MLNIELKHKCIHGKHFYWIEWSHPFDRIFGRLLGKYGNICNYCKKKKKNGRGAQSQVCFILCLLIDDWCKRAIFFVFTLKSKTKQNKHLNLIIIYLCQSKKIFNISAHLWCFRPADCLRWYAQAISPHSLYYIIIITQPCLHSRYCDIYDLWKKKHAHKSWTEIGENCHITDLLQHNIIFTLHFTNIKINKIHNLTMKAA